MIDSKGEEVVAQENDDSVDIKQEEQNKQDDQSNQEDDHQQDENDKQEEETQKVEYKGVRLMQKGESNIDNELLNKLNRRKRSIEVNTEFQKALTENNLEVVEKFMNAYIISI